MTDQIKEFHRLYGLAEERRGEEDSELSEISYDVEQALGIIRHANFTLRKMLNAK